ncbi:portal protein [Prosthecobacter fluviatilis]|uniref:Bacteriophage head to tail connecting protein n=1 Tax=Prosthecobacter fluviatilis TaxID=445931 RepID=A0ABW0KX66_9BACT
MPLLPSPAPALSSSPLADAAPHALGPAAATVAALRAKAALVRKRKKTPLEDALAANGGARAVRLVQWARSQKAQYDAGLVQWRANRLKWSQEAQDIFDHRARARREKLEMEDAASIFDMANDSVNIVAALAEFAAAQAEQDIYGGEPWFAANPVGRTDSKLADDIQHHLQWTFRDGRYLDAQCLGIDQAVTLGECFMKTLYATDVDVHEAVTPCLHADGVPVLDALGDYVTSDAQVRRLRRRLKGRLEWKDAYETRETVIRQGVEAVPVHFNDISFREDAPELDLRHTNVYVSVEMSTFEAMRRFHLSKEDAIRLARCAETRVHSDEEVQRERTADATVTCAPAEEPLGEEEADKLLNTRVRLIEAYIRADVTGTGREARVCMVFPPVHEDWIVWADYLANVSPKAELPIKCEVWEPVPHRLYGRGFFSKYSYLQTGTDNLWNQVSFRNEMHANPLTAVHEENLQVDEDGGAMVIGPGKTLRPKAGKRLGDCIEFANLPDADSRSMELFQTGMQLAQLRSGITNASQGDLSAVPESNTATGIKALISRAAVLLKKPVRRLRRSKGRGFSYAVKLFYSNFDREEAFAWGEGHNKELVKITPEHVRDLDIDVVMLLTQEQNQNKLQGAQVMMQQLQGYSGLPETDKAGARVGVVQALKALEFSNAEEMVRKPVVTLESCLPLLPPEEAQKLKGLLALQQQQEQAAAPPPPGAAPGAPGMPMPGTGAPAAAGVPGMMPPGAGMPGPGAAAGMTIPPGGMPGAEPQPA